ncbi:unnamed protein product [Hymenolepis diminuta]|uniref:Uncharacterized protein n=1 Tax=Hymenolepis diminuta TaxID=6216 RepID=A0A564YN13_HYMDI|nr:unnamed protein product [Hymenolepis diminuta]
MRTTIYKECSSSRPRIQIIRCPHTKSVYVDKNNSRESFDACKTTPKRFEAQRRAGMSLVFPPQKRLPPGHPSGHPPGITRNGECLCRSGLHCSSNCHACARSFHQK